MGHQGAEIVKDILRLVVALAPHHTCRSGVLSCIYVSCRPSGPAILIDALGVLVTCVPQAGKSTLTSIGQGWAVVMMQALWL